jgi:hypothetical protein
MLLVPNVLAGINNEWHVVTEVLVVLDPTIPENPNNLGFDFCAYPAVVAYDADVAASASPFI